MAQNVNPTFVKTPNSQVTVISTGTTGGTVTVYTGGPNGSKITGVILTANTTVTTQDVILALISSTAGTGYLNTVSVSATAGTVSTTPPSNALGGCPLPVDSDGNPFLILNSSAQSLSVFIAAASSVWSSARSLTVNVIAGDF